MAYVRYSYFEKDCRENAHATILKGNMGYDQYTVPNTEAVQTTFVAFLWYSQKKNVYGLSRHSFKIV